MKTKNIRYMSIEKRILPALCKHYGFDLSKTSGYRYGPKNTILWVQTDDVLDECRYCHDDGISLVLLLEYDPIKTVVDVYCRSCLKRYDYDAARANPDPIYGPKTKKETFPND